MTDTQEEYKMRCLPLMLDCKEPEPALGAGYQAKTPSKVLSLPNAEPAATDLEHYDNKTKTAILSFPDAEPANDGYVMKCADKILHCVEAEPPADQLGLWRKAA